MTGKHTESWIEPATEVVVPTETAEDWLAQGLLKLSPAQIDQLANNPNIRLPVEMMPVSKPKEPIPPEGWIDPIDAVHWLASHIGGDANAKLAIAERLRDGAIDCSHTWMSMGPDIGSISNRRPNFPVCGPVVTHGPWVTAIHVGAKPLMLGWAFWGFSDDWEADLKRWDWRARLFVASRQKKILVSADGGPVREAELASRSRMVVSGIRFNRDDIEKIMGTRSLSIQNPSQIKLGKTNAGKSGTRGRSRPGIKAYNYAPVMNALYADIEDGTISRFGDKRLRGTQSRIAEYIRAALTGDDGNEPSNSTTKSYAKKVLIAWRNHTG